MLLGGRRGGRGRILVTDLMHRFIGRRGRLTCWAGTTGSSPATRAHTSVASADRTTRAGSDRMGPDGIVRNVTDSVLTDRSENASPLRSTPR